jgi:hypothetical protein
MRQPAPQPVREDPEWAIARSIQLQVREGGAARITARRHPTGWYITASHPPDMPAEERADFRHFVCVRVYLLLHNGPIPGAWECGSSPEEWAADLPQSPPWATSSSSVRRAPTSCSRPSVAR